MTKNDALSLNPGDKVRVRHGEMAVVWRAPKADPYDNVIIWLNDGEEWRYHNEVDQVK